MTIFILGSMLAALGIIYGYWVHVHKRLTTIAHDKVYQSARMPPAMLIRVARARNITTVFDFRDMNEAAAVEAERIALRVAGIRHVHIPCTLRPGPDKIRTFISRMHAELVEQRRVLLHCRDGEGRAVFFAAVYRMEFEGWTPDTALRGAARLPRCLMFLNRLAPRIGRFSKRNPKFALILGYHRQAA